MTTSLYSFEECARRMWPGWERIDCHFAPEAREFRVLLSISTITLDAHMADAGRLMGRLLSDGELNVLARRIELNRRARGMKRYGRKRKGWRT